VDAAKLGHVTAHDLRHSLVANALDAGLTLPEASRLARHASPAVIASVYADVLEARLILTPVSHDTPVPTKCQRLAGYQGESKGTGEPLPHGFMRSWGTAGSHGQPCARPPD
jgi:hypothetical protein